MKNRRGSLHDLDSNKNQDSYRGNRVEKQGSKKSGNQRKKQSELSSGNNNRS